MLPATRRWAAQGTRNSRAWEAWSDCCRDNKMLPNNIKLDDEQEYYKESVRMLEVLKALDQAKRINEKVYPRASRAART